MIWDQINMSSLIFTFHLEDDEIGIAISSRNRMPNYLASCRLMIRALFFATLLENRSVGRRSIKECHDLDL